MLQTGKNGTIKDMESKIILKKPNYPAEKV